MHPQALFVREKTVSRTVKGWEREDKEWTPRGDPMERERERDQGCALKEGRGGSGRRRKEEKDK